MMLVVFSDSFNNSRQVDREIELASEDRKPILTFRITDDAFQGAKKYYLKNINWIDAFPNPKESFGPLLTNICRLLGIEEPTQKTRVTADKEIEIVREERKQTDAGVTTVPTSATTRSSTRRKAVPANSTHEYFDASLMDSMSDAEKIAYLRKWAVQGDSDAQYKLGEMYYYGNGVEEDEAEAVKWYRKAAEQGHADAQFDLGDMYYIGEGVEEDEVEAVKWYRKSAKQGNKEAKKRLKQLGK